jgi:MFS family permease
MTETDRAARPSYRALLDVPSLGRILLSMQIARIAGSMVGIVVILLALQRFNSPQLAGAIGFASIAPGMLISPVAGALLDRHGRIPLIILDYLVAATSLVMVVVLLVTAAIEPTLLLIIAAVSSLTAPLSGSGLRSLFPLLVPEHLWERVNAVDSNGWLLATVVGSPFGAVAAQLLGFEVTLSIIAAAYFLSALTMIGAPDPRTVMASTGSLMRDAWDGLVYTWNNRTLRALAVSLSLQNVAGGMVQIVVPVMILKNLGYHEDMVGYMFGIMGVFGMASAFASGRLRTAGRERRWIVLSSFGFTITTAILLLPTGLSAIALCMALAGLVNGPLDIAMFTLRQRCTDPAWMGRAFTVSMNLNFSGFPIGSAVTGAMLAIWPVEIAILFGLAANGLGAILAWALLPRGETAAAETAPAEPVAGATAEVAAGGFSPEL